MDGILHGDVQLHANDDASILKSEDDLEKRDAVRMLKGGKSPGVDNISAEILTHCNRNDVAGYFQSTTNRTTATSTSTNFRVRKNVLSRLSRKMLHQATSKFTTN